MQHIYTYSSKIHIHWKWFIYRYLHRLIFYLRPVGLLNFFIGRRGSLNNCLYSTGTFESLSSICRVSTPRKADPRKPLSVSPIEKGTEKLKKKKKIDFANLRSNLKSFSLTYTFYIIKSTRCWFSFSATPANIDDI